MTRVCIPLLFAFVACTGEGSDIGPNIPRLSEASFQVLVRHADDSDAESLGVASAVVSIAGLPGAQAATNRAGRADLRVQPSGVRNVTVNTHNASARAGDLLAGYSVSVALPGNNEVPFVLYVPDLAGSATTVVQPGLQTGLVHDDRAVSGALLEFVDGSVLGAGAATSATLRTAQLGIGKLPGRLPAPSGGGNWLTTRAILLAPSDLSIAPGASLSVPNDFGAPASSAATLWRLDPLTGVWSQVANALVDGTAARVASIGGVRGGGLYCFAIALEAETTLTGRLLDVAGRALPGVLVRAPQAWTTTDGAGRFVLPPIAGVDAAGAARTVEIVCHGGRDLRPERVSTTVALQPGVVDVGDIELDTTRVTLYRGLLVSRGRAFPRQAVGMSLNDVAVARRGFADDQARFEFDDVDTGRRVSFLLSVPDPRVDTGVLSASFVGFIQGGTRVTDERWFFDEEQWIDGINGDSIIWTVDALGHGIVDGAGVARDTGDGVDRYLETTRNGRLLRGDFGDLDGQATASIETGQVGRQVVSAFSTRRARTSRTEIPLQRALRARLGRFEPFALVTGTLDAVGDTRRVRGTALASREDWLDQTLGARAAAMTLPTPVDPALTGQLDFVVGVPAVAGNFAAVAGTTTGGSEFVLQRVWLRDTLGLAAGSRTALDLGGSGRDADTTFVTTRGLEGLDPAIAVADLVFDLAIELAPHNVVDVVRGVGRVDPAGSIVVTGADVGFVLPALTGTLGTARHLVVLRGAGDGNGAVIEQRTFAEFGAGAASPTVPFLAAPQITSPSAGEEVSIAGFEVQFTPPADCAYTVIELRQENVEAGITVVRDWTALLPPDETRFRFRTLPAPMITPLAAGEYSLTVRCARIGGGRLTRLDLPYERIASRFVGLSLAEREVDAVSSARIDLTLR